MRRLSASPVAWATVTACVVAVLAGWKILASPGLPAFVHDWSWPPYLGAAWASFVDYLHPYVATDFGGINYYQGGAPFAACIVVAEAIAGSIIGLKIVVAALLVTSAVGAFALARRFDAALPVASAAAVLYGASPVVGNELVAGHLAYLCGYAALPLIATLGLRIARGPKMLLPLLGLIAIVPLSVAQPQFALFDALVLAALLPFATSVRTRIALALVALCALAASPSEVLLALFGHPLTDLGFDRTNLHWITANSAQRWPAFLGTSYVRQYDAGASASLIGARVAGGIALWALAVCGALMRPRALAFAVVAVVAAMWCAGANGAMWNEMRPLFEHVGQLAAFRELYHASVLVMLGLVVLIAQIRIRGAAGAAAVVLAATLFALPQLSGAFLAPVAYDPMEIAHIGGLVAADPHDGYVMYWPMVQPLGPDIADAGSDPDAFPIGAHAALSAFSIRQPLSQLQTSLCDPKTDVRALLARLGVRYVVIRPQWHSYADALLEPGLRDVVRLAGKPACDDALVARLPIVWRGGTHALAEIPDARPVFGPASPAAFRRLRVDLAATPSTGGADPRIGWVDANRWQWWSAQFAGPVNPGVFTLGTTPLALPAARSVVLDAPLGATIEGDFSPRRIPPAPGYRAIPLPEGARRLIANGPTIVTGVMNFGESLVDPHSPAFDESRALELVLSAGSPWVLRDNDGRTVAPRDDAWDDVWDAPPSGAPYTLAFAPSFAVMSAAFAQYVAWIGELIAFAAFVLLSVRERRAAPTR